MSTAIQSGVYGPNDTLITRRVEEAIPYPQVNEIENTTLDGQPHTQIIGQGFIVVETTAHFTYPQLRTLYSLKMTGASVKVIFDGHQYTGPIRGLIEPERIPSTKGPVFPAVFTILVQSEGAV